MALTYSITGGADAQWFKINPTSGELSFTEKPNFEDPADKDKNNVYQVEVGVSDGTTTTKQTINVTVSDVAEGNLPPQITSPSAFTVPENTLVVMTVTATDPDAGTQPPIEPPVEPPPSGGWPNASNTGVPAGTQMTTHNGHFHTSAAGQEVTAIKVTGILIIQHPNVKIRKCQAVSLHGGHESNATGLLIEDTTIAGDGSWGSGISLVGAPNSTIQRCNVYGVENGIWLQASDCIVRDNWIHNLASPGNPEPHYDGIQSPNCARAQFIHNFIDHPNSSSSIAVYQHNDAKLTNNKLNGGSYTVYFEGTCSGGVVKDCEFVSCTFGWCDGASWNVQTFTNNTFGGGAPINGLPTGQKQPAATKEATGHFFARHPELMKKKEVGADKSKK